VVTDVVRSLLAEPRAPDPPVRVWRDWALVAALALAFGIESLLRTDVPWRAVGVVEVLVLSYALVNRRRRPLAMLALGFGTAAVVDLVTVPLIGHASPTSMGFVLVLLYALFRWASGREVVLGSAIALLAAAASFVRDRTDLGETIAGMVVLTLPAALGATVRFWSTSRTRQLDQMRLLEREMLARELHDTVAHHVSAMVIRAQAGRVVAATSPGAAIEALEIIEHEGSRTLAEMRSMVGALRQGDGAEMAPRSGVDDLAGLARADGAGRVEVRSSGDLTRLSPAVDAAVYRIAQESVTNALRHSRHATHIIVTVDVRADRVAVEVTDDGDPVTGGRAYDGYGIVGMTERAALLGGTLVAGPGASRGWTVSADLPAGRGA
jgi:signal transduction histidine kinase